MARSGPWRAARRCADQNRERQDTCYTSSVIAVTVTVVAIIVLVSVGLSIVEFRRFTPLVFRCRRCGIDFLQAPYLEFPRACPRCHARDWAA
jgi:hypothetical protein